MSLRHLREAQEVRRHRGLTPSAYWRRSTWICSPERPCGSVPLMVWRIVLPSALTSLCMVANCSPFMRYVTYHSPGPSDVSTKVSPLGRLPSGSLTAPPPDGH